VEVGFFDTADFARRVDHSATTLYVADNDNGVYILEFDPPPTPTAFRGVSIRVDAHGVALQWGLWTDEPLAGLNVYRRGSSGPFIRLNTGGLLPPLIRRYTDDSVLPGRSYEYRVGAVSQAGTETLSEVVAAQTAAARLALHQNAPNPFNPSTTIGFTLDRPVAVTLEIFDASGRRVRTLIDSHLGAGYRSVDWDGRNAAGAPVGSGVYIYRLTAGKQSLARKMTLLK
jgi:hypothetical protein